MQALIQVCSARGITAKPLNAMVKVQLLGEIRDTIIKKNCGERPLWNQTLSFVIPGNIGSEHDLFIWLVNCAWKKPKEIGVAKFKLPSDSLNLIDTWLPLLDSNGAASGAAVHLCIQIEAIVSKSKSQKSLVTAAVSSSRIAKEEDEDQGEELVDARYTRYRSDFEGHAGAVSINEIVESLERVKAVLDSSSTNAQLQSAKQQIQQVREQIDVLDFDPEYKSKFSNLALGYEQLCVDLIAEQSWKHVTERTNKPSPLPSREQRQLIRITPFNSSSSPASNGFQMSSSTSASQPTSIILPLLQKRPSKSGDSFNEVKSHYIETIEKFDEFMNQGYVVEFPSFASSLSEEGAMDGNTLLKSRPGDLIHATCIGFIYDGTTMLAARYCKWTLESVLGIPPEFCPRGLDRALVGLWANCQCTITISPNLGFGDNGTDEVPPNSNLVFQVHVHSFDPPPGSIMAEMDLFKDESPYSPKGEFLELRKKPSVIKTDKSFISPSARKSLEFYESPKGEFLDFDSKNVLSPVRKSRSLSSVIPNHLSSTNPFDMLMEDEALTTPTPPPFPPPPLGTPPPLDILLPRKPSLSSSSFDNVTSSNNNISLVETLDEFNSLSPPRSPSDSPPPTIDDLLLQHDPFSQVTPPTTPLPKSPVTAPPVLSKELVTWLSSLGMENFAHDLEFVGVVSIPLLLRADLSKFEELRPLIFAQEILKHDFELL